MDMDIENENDSSKDSSHWAGFRYLENIFLLVNEGGYTSEDLYKIRGLSMRLMIEAGSQQR